jgi:hypothetical protein
MLSRTFAVIAVNKSRTSNGSLEVHCRPYNALLIARGPRGSLLFVTCHCWGGEWDEIEVTGEWLESDGKVVGK